jgi:integrase/recombinase XerC
MSKFPVANTTVQRWLLDGPLAAYVPTYLDRLRQGRYSENTIKHKLHALAYVGRWMALCRFGVEALDERRVERFLHDHLPRCRCASPLRRYPADGRAVLTQLLALLRELGDEGASTGAGPGAYRDASALPSVGLAAGIPEDAVIM